MKKTVSYKNYSNHFGFIGIIIICSMGFQLKAQNISNALYLGEDPGFKTLINPLEFPGLNFEPKGNHFFTAFVPNGLIKNDKPDEKVQGKNLHMFIQVTRGHYSDFNKDCRLIFKSKY
jgi:hypothetical protein